MPQRLSVREFADLPSVSAPRAGAGAFPSDAARSRDERADVIAEWVGARW